MILDKDVKQYSTEIINKINFDLIIVASGYETRAGYIAQTYNPIGRIKIALTFDNYSSLNQRIENDKLFSSLGYTFIKSEGDTDETIIDFLNTVRFDENLEYNILVDYSSMTRIWYSSILDFFRYFEVSHQLKINIYFVYSKAIFVPPPEEEVPNRHISPLKGFYNMSLPVKPTLLIIGLGYERIRAFGLTEFLDAETLLFYTDPADQNKFSLEVEKNNEELLRIVSDENIFKYSLNKLEHLHRIINSICTKLNENYRIIIAPCGPKPFTLLALINSILIGGIDVWRISPGVKGLPQNRTSNGEVFALLTSFISQS